jgi:hypothetical protein
VLTRRTFLDRALQMSAAAVITPKIGRFAGQSTVVRLRLKQGTAPVLCLSISRGLGYEMSSVAAAGLLRPANDRYVELIRSLGRNGVLRAGTASRSVLHPTITTHTARSTRRGTTQSRKRCLGYRSRLLIQADHMTG